MRKGSASRIVFTITLLALAGTSQADVLCKSKNGALKARSVCKRKQTTVVDLAELSLVPDNVSHADNATHADTASNADQLGGAPPSAYAASTVVRSVTLAADGTVDAARSDGVAQANVSHPSTGAYCIDGLDPAPKGVVAQLAFGGSFGAQIFSQVDPSGSVLCSGLQIGVATYSAANAPANQPVTLIIH